MHNVKNEISIRINDTDTTLTVGQDESLLEALRNAGFFSVKYGCDDGTCGVCTVLMDGIPVRSCMIKAVEAAGKDITTLEGLSQGDDVHPIQQAFMDTGAIQCGFCTPAQILAVKSLLDRELNPSEDEIRRVLNGILCRCTGYVRAVSAVERAAAMLRGESIEPYTHIEKILPTDASQIQLPEEFYRRDGERTPLPPLVFTPQEMEKTRTVGKPEVKVDAKKLAQGRPVFTDDLKIPGMLYGALLTSPHAHARILSINTSRARALPGVHAVLTYQDIARVKYASGGQSYPQPQPYDQVSLDDKVQANPVSYTHLRAHET